ncbi:MAG: Zn-dependent hydrolase [Alteromonas sp.]|uniref:Zn-dependent hydrolase n=2 Tax=Alteromonas australica TaxID=589873 RepID=A0A358E0F4_9ALTE|nr:MULTISPECIES: Zn-dependent hydrolase [Alteromonas]MAB92234.1 Zn-dependent hydrolase [Alteromonas sp.]MAO29280.1 Zn-dependent hydrolase [Alteromonas sp.]MBU32320.1 Zn-dependent hydrolase [Alteromonas sp.]QPL49854.1 Zn-dependent hydrolase [Alteromonas sp. B31-7]HAI73675.1 Zn-dependent hydrolase [Alteromonas australica]|tara:strand:- start:33143 stop:34375 length:1233 start_codon:yes stop_codon:yes gene_type:complete
MTLQVNGERLWSSLMEMARIGGTEKGGCNRQALTDKDKQGRALFIRWCEEIGCTLRVDEMGNLFLRKAGRDNSLPPVLTGSHLDTQPTGGKFDGVYGVLAGLEVLRTLHDANIETLHPIEVAVWTNEEGARFSPAMVGSGVWSGEFSLDYGWSRKDKSGVSIKEELERHGYLGGTPCAPFNIKAALELHIEQGPILEAIEKPIGVVQGVQGMRWYDLVITGQPVHAGPTPMEQRRDPMKAIAKIVSELYHLAEETGPLARATFGDINASPGSRNTVPEQVTLTVDLRHPDQQVLDNMDAAFRRIAQDICNQCKVEHSIVDEWNSPAVAFNASCIDAVRFAAEQAGLPYEEMFSGAGHDSVYVSKVAPTSMIFIPCENGISHNEAENATPEDITAGCQVLLGAMVQLANAE